MTYRQLSPEERYMLAALKRQGRNQAEMTRSLGRHRSTVCRELGRNSTRAGGHYRAATAQECTDGRRSRSRRNRRFSKEDFAVVEGLLRRQWSPAQVAGRTGVAFYFARPYHSWERGSNENPNGLIRRYLPKGESMAGLSQQQCNAIARKLNTRPRKRLRFRTPLECFNES